MTLSNIPARVRLSLEGSNKGAFGRREVSLKDMDSSNSMLYLYEDITYRALTIPHDALRCGTHRCAAPAPEQQRAYDDVRREITASDPRACEKRHHVVE